MSKFDEAMNTYREQLGLLDGEFDDALLTQIAKNLGPSIYLEDASRVSCSDKDEKIRVMSNFLVGKLGLDETPELIEVVEAVCAEMGTSNRNKYRAVFYYLLVKNTDMAHRIMN